MSIAYNVNLFSVLDRVMLVTHRWQSVIDVEFIGVNLRTFFDVIRNNRQNSIALYVGNRSDFQLTAALCHAENSRLGLGASSLIIHSPFAGVLVLFVPAEIRLVNFHFAREWVKIFCKNVSYF